MRAFPSNNTNWSADSIFQDYAEYIINTIPIRTKTRESYLSILNCHVRGHVLDTSIAEIERQDLVELLSGLSPQIRSKSLAVLKTIFREARNSGLILETPTTGIRIPTPIVASRKFLTWEDVSRIEFGKYDTQIRFLALHGLRWGEAVVLNDCDIRNGRIYVNKSIHGETKSQSGIRVVPLVSEFRQFPKSPKTLRKALDPFGVTIHSLRHTYAYILKTQGIHVTTAQKLLGHSDIKVTLKVYTEVLDDEIDAAGTLIRLMTG